MRQLPGYVRALSISTVKGVAKSNVPAAKLLPDWGMAGDAHAGPWHRQVSLLAVESIEKMRAEGLEVEPGGFAENVTTAGLDTLGLHVGDRISVGEALLEVTQIGKACHGGCPILERVGTCIMPREGIFTRVIKGGLVRVGDAIAVEG
jgi:MOSC domain-containing protein YiiM